MAGRGGERFEKRLRERARQEKAAAKRARRADRKDGEDAGDGEDDGPKLSEDELLEQVRILNEQHAAGDVDDEDYEERKLELFEQLGLA
jgi:hypothetical protein